MIELSARARTHQADINSVLFDLDGVLIDITRSIRPALCLTIPLYLRTIARWPAGDALVTSADIELFKHAGGFNDDIDLACALVLHYLVRGHENPDASPETLNIMQPNLQRYAMRVAERGGGLKHAEAVCLESFSTDDSITIQGQYRKDIIRRMFLDLFAGEHSSLLYGREPEWHSGPGMVNEDVPLVQPEWLIPGRTYGVLTGRDRAEARFGLRLAGIDHLISDNALVTQSDARKKPQPDGLILLRSRLQPKIAVYVGDTLDDLRTVQNANRKVGSTAFLSALVLTGPAGKSNEKLFRRNEPDILADTVESVMAWINAIDPGTSV